MPTIVEALNMAMEHHQRGELREAESIYRQILEVAPEEADVLHRLGLLALQLGKHQLAIEYLKKSIDFQPKVAAYHCNLGVAYRDWGRLEDAMASYKQALKVDPNLAEAHNNLGVLQKERLLWDEAVESLREAVRLHPNYVEANFNLAQSLHGRGDSQEAAGYYQRVLQLAPQDADAHNSYALLLQQSGQAEGAWQHYQRSLQIRPNHADTHYNVGLLLQEQGVLDQAVAAYREAIRLNPRMAAAHNNLGIVLTEVSRFDPKYREVARTAFDEALKIQPKYPEALNNRGIAQAEQGLYTAAIDSFRKSLELQPKQPEAHNNLGNALKDQGRLDEAIAAYQAALEIQPNYTSAESNLLMAMHYSASHTTDEMFAAAVKFGTRLAERITPLARPANDRNPERRLRLGYVGADLRRNPVGYFIEGVLANHDPAQVEVYLYANQSINDDLTDRLVKNAQHWRRVVGFTDEALANLIRQDQIDILIDLSGHTGKHRLLTFARKPAPIQATWMGYFATTGMPAIDYIIADRFVIPPDEENQYVERILRLPDSYLCFTAPDLPVEIGTLPAESKGFVTFGCFNNLAKITPQVLKVWARILKSVPESQIYLKYKPLADSGTRDHFRRILHDLGVSPHYVRLEESSPRLQLLEAYSEVDIGLDPFPFGGGTTTAEALWMGVPVITLRGNRFVSHVGESFLSSAGEAELIAVSADEYVEKAVALASDLPKLAARRRQLRSVLLQSPLCDAGRFTRALEAGLREVWRKWCHTGDPAGASPTAQYSDFT